MVYKWECLWNLARCEQELKLRCSPNLLPQILMSWLPENSGFGSCQIFAGYLILVLNNQLDLDHNSNLCWKRQANWLVNWADLEKAGHLSWLQYKVGVDWGARIRGLIPRIRGFYSSRLVPYVSQRLGVLGSAPMILWVQIWTACIVRLGMGIREEWGGVGWWWLDWV